MPTSDKTIQKLETRFPTVSGSAFAEAQAKVLASGHSVLVSEKGIIYRVYPDGRRKIVKRVDPPTDVVPGSKLTIP